LSTLSVANDFSGGDGVDAPPDRAATTATGADTDERCRNASLIVPVDEDSAVAGLTQQEAGADASKKDSPAQEEKKQTAEEESLSKSQEDQSDDKSGGGMKRFVSHTHGVCIDNGNNRRRYLHEEQHHELEDDGLGGNVLRYDGVSVYVDHFCRYLGHVG